MRLFVAEKPSLGRAIAEALPSPQRKLKGCIECGGSDESGNPRYVVTWCVGHLLSLADPHIYNPQFKRWDLRHLPIIPQQWQFVPKPEVQEQLDLVLKLIQQADEIVHAGDPDREGQLLVDEVFNYAQLSPTKISQIKRCLINDLTPSAVQKSLANLQPNKNFVALSTSALARSRADWLYGINLTRYYTLKERKNHFYDKENSPPVLSVGRVQTPVLGLVVTRDLAIKNFTPRDFFEVEAEISYSPKSSDPFNPSEFCKNFPSFRAKWQPSESCEPYQDEDGRILSRNLAELVASKITHNPAPVTLFENKTEKENPPLPYSLSALQIEASRRYDLTAQQVLDCCQRLYEVHKLITYPRSDCRYLPDEQFNLRHQILSAIQSHCEGFQNLPAGFNLEIKNKCWDTTKVEAHHGIIPTIKTQKCNLTPSENKIYALIAGNFLAQFYPEATYHKRKIELEIAGGKFMAQRRQLASAGWKALLKSNLENDDEENNPILDTAVGEELFCQQGHILSKKTTAPRPFTDATLLSAMTGIARFVEDKELKKILRASDGLGTEATRAGIIELLFKRNFLYKQGRNIHATERGVAHIQALPPLATSPDLTAHWEQQLTKISANEYGYGEFMENLLKLLPTLLI